MLRRPRPEKISELKAGRKETGFGEILLSGVAFYQNKKKRVFEVVVGDGSGTIILKWFRGNEKYLRDRFKKGRKLIFSGEVRRFNYQREIHHPDVEVVDGDIEKIITNDRSHLFRNRRTLSEDIEKVDEDHLGWICR
jgi:ATP-dependent DNA helicase RecG